MFRILLSAAAILGAFQAVASSFAAEDRPAGYEGYQVVHIAVQDAAELRALGELQLLLKDFEVWSEVVRSGTIEARVSPAGLAALWRSGLAYEVVIPDLQRYIDQQYAGGRDFFDSLRSYTQHVTFMNELVAAYPDLAQMVSLGNSVQGRAMWALRITGPGYAKPALLYHGAEHGNEQAPASVVAYVANYLLTNYASDPNVAYLVDNVEWFLMPIMNPDGYVSYSRYNAHGVDLNRNWGGPGSGQDPSGGPFPFSEPETQCVRDFLITHPGIRVHIDLHGYVPWIMWPWGHTAQHCPDHDTFLAVGTVFRDLIYAAGGGLYDIGTIYEVAYPVSGSSTNYSYGVLDRWAFGIEVVDSSMPSICQEFLASMVYVGDWIRSTDCNGNGETNTDDIAGGSSTDLNGNGVPDECEGLGDLNCDWQVGLGDINPFVLALSNPVSYAAQFPGCPLARRDIDGDGDFGFGDINPFVALLSGK